VPAKTVEFPTPALRPMNSGLDCGRVERKLLIPLPDWKINLAQCLEN